MLDIRDTLTWLRPGGFTFKVSITTYRRNMASHTYIIGNCFINVYRQNYTIIDHISCKVLCCDKICCTILFPSTCDAPERHAAFIYEWWYILPVTVNPEQLYVRFLNGTEQLSHVSYAHFSWFPNALRFDYWWQGLQWIYGCKSWESLPFVIV